MANSFDRLVATEWVTVANGKFVESSNSQSILVNTDIELFDNQYKSMIKTTGELAHAFPSQVGATTCFADPQLSAHMNGGAAGFIDELYTRVYRPWHSVAQSTPTLHLDLKLPPLLAIVLSRAPWREQIPEVLKELREELGQSRSELNRLNEMIDSCMSQADLIYQTQRINESFDAIVPESLQTSASLRSRNAISIFNFLKALYPLFSIAANPHSADPDKFFDLVDNAMNLFSKSSSRIVSRSIPATKMARLLRTV